MNIFDKICAVLAFVLGALFLILGVVGLFTGCKAHFVLPPVLGVIPALVGWGIVKPIVVAWNRPRSTTPMTTSWPQQSTMAQTPPPEPPTPPRNPPGYYQQ